MDTMGECNAKEHKQGRACAHSHIHLTSGTTGDGVLGMVTTSSPFSALALMPAQVARCHPAATNKRARLVSTILSIQIMAVYSAMCTRT